MIHLVLPLPPSVNKAYAWYKVRHKSNLYKKWEIEAQKALKTQNKYTIVGDNWLSAMYVLHIDLHFKNGNKRIIDCGNFEKLTSDFLAHHIDGFHDHKILALSVMKKQKTGEEDLIECCIDEIITD